MSLRLAMNSLAFIQITSLIRVPRASCRRAVSCREDEKDESYHTSNIFGRGTGGDGRAVVERLSRNRWYVYINERWFTSASGILLPAFVTSSSS